MAAHRYWRIKPRLGVTYFSVQEIELRTSVGGSDETSPSTTISIGAFQDGVAGKCIDNNTGTYCQQSPASSAWILIDFGSGVTKDIVEVGIAGSPHGTDRSPQEFDIESSDDGSTFTVEWSCSYSQSQWTTGSTLIAFAKPSAIASRYWRVRPSATGDGNLGLAELVFRETSGGSQAASGGSGISWGPAAGGTSLANLFDGNAATDWANSGGANVGAAYLGYDWGSGVTKSIVEVLMQARSANPLQAPTAGLIESSPDGKNWVSRITFSGLSWSGGSTNTVGGGGGGGGAWVPRIMIY